MSIQIRAWYGPWTEVSEDRARKFTVSMGALNSDSIEGAEARMKNHLRGITITELFKGHEDELPVWLKGVF